jgi:hypothetical protein
MVFATVAVLAACSEGPLAPTNPDLAMNAAAAATFTDFVASDVVTGLADPGTIAVQGRHIMLRGVVVTSRIDGSDPRVSGNATITINGQLLLADGSGSVWGKFEVAADVGGTWAGSWAGQRELTAPGLWTGTLKLVGHGDGGAVDGLQMKGVELVYTNTLIPSGFVGLIRGSLLDPH